MYFHEHEVNVYINKRRYRLSSTCHVLSVIFLRRLCSDVTSSMPRGTLVVKSAQSYSFVYKWMISSLMPRTKTSGALPRCLEMGNRVPWRIQALGKWLSPREIPAFIIYSSLLAVAGKASAAWRWLPSRRPPALAVRISRSPYRRSEHRTFFWALFENPSICPAWLCLLHYCRLHFSGLQ